MNNTDPNINVEKIVPRYLDWLDSEIDIQWAYHNQKETMAWSATAGYLSILVLTYKAAPYLSNLAGEIVFCGFLLALAYATYLFVNMQFQMRWEAADRSRGLSRARAILCSITTDKEINDLNKDFDKDLEEKRKAKPWIKAVEYPQFITDEIKKAKTQRQNWHQICEILFPSLCQALCKASFIWPSTLENINGRTRSEFASYLILAVVTAVSILMILFGPLKGAAG